MIKYVIAGAVFVAVGVFWLSLFLFSARKKTVETTNLDSTPVSDEDLARLEEAHEKLRRTYRKTAINTLAPCILIGVGIFLLAVAVISFAGLI